MSAFLSKLNPFKQETLTVSNTVKTLTASAYNATSEFNGTAGGSFINIPRKARAAKVENTSSNAIRYTEELTAPVAATTGSLLNPGDFKFLESLESIQKFKMIREGASDATVDVSYYR